MTAADLSDPDGPTQRAIMQREHGTFRYASLVALGSGLLMNPAIALRACHPGWVGGSG